MSPGAAEEAELARDIVAALRDHARLIAEEVGRLLENERMSLAAI